MQRFFYIGEYPEGKSDMVAFGGFVFSPGVSVELPEPFATKARGNRFFVPDTADEPIADVVAEVKPEAQPSASVIHLHGFSKPELIGMAEGSGVKIDRRWSSERIRDAIIEAANQLPKGA